MTETPAGIEPASAQALDVTGDGLVIKPPRPASRRASAVRAIRSNFGASLMIQALNMISGVELARGLGLLGRGELAAAMLWPMVIGGIGVLGIEESMTYHVARARGKVQVGRLLGSALVLCAIQAALFTTLTLIAVPIVLHKHNSATITSGLIFTVYVAIAVFALALNGTLNGLHRYRAYNAARLSIGVTIVTAQTVLLFVAGSFHVRLLVIVMIGCYVACMLFDIGLVLHARPGRLTADRKTMRTIFSFAARSTLGNTSSLLNQRLDQLVISTFLTSRQLGVYVVAVTFTLFTPMVGASIAVAALTNVASLETPQQQALLARRMVSGALLGSIVASLPIIILAPLLIKLFFGSAFAIGADITRVTAVAAISFSTARTLEGVLRGLGRPLAAGMAELVALGGTVACLAVLLPTLGLIGAAWASLIAYTVSATWMVMRVRKVTGISARQLLLPDREGVAILRSYLTRLRVRPSRG